MRKYIYFLSSFKSRASSSALTAAHRPEQIKRQNKIETEYLDIRLQVIYFKSKDIDFFSMIIRVLPLFSR